MQPEPGVDLGDAFSTTMMLTLSNVQQLPLNGGGANQSLLERPLIKNINPGGDQAEDIVVLSALLSHCTSRVGGSIAGNITPPAFVDDEDILFFPDGAQLNEHNENEKSGHRKAGVQSATEKEQNLLQEIMISFG
jgi:hypothetical protein